MPSFKNLSNQKFGRLTAIHRGPNSGKRSTWHCLCDCGNTAIVYSSKLVNGHTQSCGCLQKERASQASFKHGHSCYPNKGKATKEYNAWSLMIRRCTDNKNAPEFKNYAARGITVCIEWQHSFETFLKDMGLAPSPKHSIDRIDNNCGYSKENCRWATAKEQARNKRTTAFLTAYGKTKTISEWSEITGISIKRIHARLKRGWSPEKTISTPV